MDFFEVVKKRKAVRKYLPDKEIPDKDIDKILETVSLAPSAGNLQSYKIFVGKSKEARRKIFEACYNQRSDFIRNAALILVFCTDTACSKERFGERGKLYAIQDATIAGSFAVLAVTALGYGSCWVGNFETKKVQKILKTKLTPIAAIIIGYPNKKSQRPSRKPLHLLAEFV